MSYFEWFGLPEQFRLNEKELRRLFLKKSRELHPDFHTLAPEREQAELLQQATFNNEAYQTLLDFEARIKYMLNSRDLLGDAAKTALPQSFLLEMMDINEALLEVETDFDTLVFAELQANIAAIENDLYIAVNELLDTTDANSLAAADWEKIKIFYLKYRYLLRIQKKLLTFASQ